MKKFEVWKAKYFLLGALVCLPSVTFATAVRPMWTGNAPNCCGAYCYSDKTIQECDGSCSDECKDSRAANNACKQWCNINFTGSGTI